ncbi:hypothetical protein GCM10028822_42770 [Hymenobacter terrigena]
MTFTEQLAQLPALLADLKACPPAARAELAQRILKNTPGIYAFYHDDQPVYVGRTRDLRRRLNEHSRPKSSHYSASFAFLRAWHSAEAAGHTASLAGKSRSALAGHEVFGPLFVAEKLAVSGMTVRWVKVADAVTQALLEVYAALELQTPFNSFETS